MATEKISFYYVIVTWLCCSVIQLSQSFFISGPPVRESFNHESHVLGGFTEEIKSSLFYQSYVPVVIKVRIPDWREGNLRLNKSLSCPNDAEASGSLCPIAYHLEGILSPMSLAMRFYKNVFSAANGDFYEHNFSCDKIKPHFQHFSTQLGGLLPYLNEFRNRCPLGKNLSLTTKSVTPIVAQYAVTAFNKMKELQEQNVKDKKEESSSEWNYIEMASYAALQNSYLLTQYVDSVRWANAFATCQSFKLDMGLISPLMLNETLSELSRNLNSNGYSFALPFLNTLPHYYKIPLVDCILTMSNSIFNVGFNINGWLFKPPAATNNGENATANLIVRILVPVVKSGLTHKLIKLNKVPYLKKEGKVEKICEIQNFQPDDVYLVEVNETTGSEFIVGKVSPLCLSSKLCKVPEASHRQIVDPCVMGIITKNHDLTSKSCYFDCFSVPSSPLSHDFAFPIFTRLASNKFAVTGLAPDTFPLLLLECGGKTTHAFRPNTTEGAILVSLPCGCSLVMGHKRFKAQNPCDEPLAVEHVTEFGTHHHHQSQPQIGVNDPDFVDYLIDTVDSKAYNLTYSDKNTTASGNNGTETTESAEAGKLVEKEETASDDTQDVQKYHCGHILLWIFLITILILNFITIFVLYKNSIINFGNFTRGRSNNMTRFENETTATDMHTSPM